MRLKIHQQRPQVELVSTTSDAGTHPPIRIEARREQDGHKNKMGRAPHTPHQRQQSPRTMLHIMTGS